MGYVRMGLPYPAYPPKKLDGYREMKEEKDKPALAVPGILGG